jgi:hypothetical protein
MSGGLPFSDRDYFDLPLAEQISRAEEWLKEHPDDQAGGDIVWRSLAPAYKNAYTKSETEKAVLATEKAEMATKYLKSETEKAEMATKYLKSETEKAELATERAEMATKITKLETANAELVTENVAFIEKNKGRSLIAALEKFPAVHDHTKSAPFISRTHKAARVNEEPLDNSLLLFADSLITPEFLDVPYTKVLHPDSDSEHSVVATTITPLLVAIVSGLKLGKVVQVVQNRSLAGVGCDVLLVYMPNRLPFATLEVKKPGTLPEHRNQVFFGKERSIRGRTRTENLVAGQVFDEMMAIKLFGFETVYGMITTGNHWRLVSTDPFESVELNSMSSWEKVLSRLDKDQSINPEDTTQPKSTQSPGGQEVEFTNRAVHYGGRQIFASGIVPDLMLGVDDETMLKAVENSGREIFQLIITFVLRACGTLSHFLSRNESSLGSVVIRKTMASRTLTPNANVYAFGKITIKRVAKKFPLSTYDNPMPATIHVIQHLGSGDHGSCCLAVSEKQDCWCVVKFFHDRAGSTSLAAAELNNWKRVYGKRSVLPLF